MAKMNIKVTSSPAIGPIDDFDGTMNVGVAPAEQCLTTWPVTVTPDDPSFSGKYELVVPPGNNAANDIVFRIGKGAPGNLPLTGNFSGTTVFYVQIFSWEAPNNSNSGTTVELKIYDSSNTFLTSRTMFRKDKGINCFDQW